MPLAKSERKWHRFDLRFDLNANSSTSATTATFVDYSNNTMSDGYVALPSCRERHGCSLCLYDFIERGKHVECLKEEN